MAQRALYLFQAKLLSIRVRFDHHLRQAGAQVPTALMRVELISEIEVDK